MGQNQRWIVIAGGAVAVALVAIVVALYVLGGRGPGAGGAGILERIRNGVATITSGFAPTKVASLQEFAFRRLDIDTTKPQAEACLVFTRDLDASGRTHYEDY